MRLLIALVPSAALALLGAVYAGARPAVFDGDVCSLVSRAAARAAAVTAPCTQAKAAVAHRPAIASARWGTRSPEASHFLSVEIGPPAAFLNAPKGPLLPLTGKLQGPVTLLPGVHAYYTTAPVGVVSTRFAAHGEICRIVLVDATKNALPGALAVARSVAARL